MDHAASARRSTTGSTAATSTRSSSCSPTISSSMRRCPGSRQEGEWQEGVGQLFTMFQAAFPEMRWEAEDVLAAGDKVAARVRVSGSLAHEHWGVFDMMSLMQQLGVAPGAPHRGRGRRGQPPPIGKCFLCGTDASVVLSETGGKSGTNEVEHHTATSQPGR